MTTINQLTPANKAAYYFAMVLLFVILAVYGRPALEWLLMKLYEIFIQGTPINII